MTNRWRRGALEAIVIVGSILLAFWIDAAWDGAQARGAEAEALEAVSAEVVRNLSALAVDERRIREYQEDVDRFLRAAPTDLRGLSPEAIADWVAGLGIPIRYDPGLGAIERLAALPATAASEQGVEVRMLISRLVSQLTDAQRRAQRMSDVSAEVFSAFARYGVPATGEGRDRINRMVGRAGPDVLVDVRNDDALVASIIESAHWREVYLSELDNVRETLEALATALGAEG